MVFSVVSLGLSLDVLIYIKGIVNQNQVGLSLRFKFRVAYIYTWVNVNLKLGRTELPVFPKIHVSLLTENEPTCALPFSFHFSFD